MKVKAILGGLVLALGSQMASAEIIFRDTDLTKSELYFNLWNGEFEGAQAKSYTLDLGIRFLDILANPQAFNGQSFNITTGDPDLDNIRATSKWSVLGLNDDGGNTNGVSHGGMVTVSPDGPALTVGTGGNGTFNNLGNLIAGMSSLTDSLNLKQPTTGNGSAIYVPSDDGFLGRWQTSSDDLGGAVFFQTSSLTTTTTMEMYLLVSVLDPNSFEETTLIGNGGVKIGDWVLDTSAKTLTFNAATAPIPVPAAVWLFGSALSSLIAFGRRKLA